jgi:hypothetical protein
VCSYEFVGFVLRADGDADGMSIPEISNWENVFLVGTCIRHPCSRRISRMWARSVL